jgi:Flp pilus assembly protein TadD
MDSGNLERAEDLLRRAVLLEPHSGDAHGELAIVLEKRGEIASARGEWGAVLAVNPDYPGALIRLARCCNLLGRYEETVAVLEQHLADPENLGSADLLAALAVAYHSLGRDDEALWAIDKSLEAHADPRLLALRRAWEHSQRDS